jgi:hypothetical protein
MREVVWCRVRFVVPHDWEMLGFSRDPERGECWFADRYEQRLEFRWRRLEGGAPDVARMARDYRGRLTEEGTFENVRRVSRGKWEGVAASTEALGISRFIRHLTEERYLIEMVFHWPENERDEKLEQQLLQSLRLEPEARFGDLRWHRWRAFGMDMMARDHFAFTECSVKPAEVYATFGRKRNPVSEQRFGRIGMVPFWLKGPVDEWLRLKVPPRTRIDRRESFERAGHTMHYLEGRLGVARRVPVFEVLRSFSAAAWQCPSDHRLYYVHQLGALEGGADGPDVFQRTLVCCPELGGAVRGR